MRDHQGVCENLSEMMNFDPGFDIRVSSNPMGFEYGSGVFGPLPELRSLDAIRQSLLDPLCDGPDPVYAIAMDVGRVEHRSEIERRNLLFGVVTYAQGRLGDEPIRSQGHVHKVSSHSGWSPPEVYEIWNGRALVYMQEFAADAPGRCFAIEASVGDVVVVPPGWAHATVSADAQQPLTFGAWCDREYRFVYDQVRARNGLAWYPLITGENRVRWRPNPHYRTGELEVRPPRAYDDLGLADGSPIYKLFEKNHDSVQWVSKPVLVREVWRDFAP